MYWPEFFLGPGNTERAPHTESQTYHTPANGWGGGGSGGGEDGGYEGGSGTSGDLSTLTKFTIW